MSLELQQTVSLVICTNAKLQGHELDYGPDLCTIKFAEKVPLPDGVPSDVAYDDRKMLALNPSSWFEILKQREVTRLKLHYVSSSQELPDRIGAAFVGGGGKWIVEAVHGSKSDIYEKGERASRVSGSTFLGFHFLLIEKDVNPSEETAISIDTAHEKLETVLKKAEEFARGQEYTLHWAENFESYREILTDEVPIAYDELFPSDIIEDKVRHLLAGAFSSWVFGGMGSWNDLSFDEESQKEYEAISDELFNAIHQAIIAGVNNSR